MTDLTLDDLLVALLHERRRGVLLDLLHNESISTEALQDVEMVHSHLPKLDDLELIDWMPDEPAVSRGPLFDDALPTLKLLENDELHPTNA